MLTAGLHLVPRLDPDDPRGVLIRARFEPLLAAGLLDSVDAHVVTRLGRLIGTWDADVLIACAAALIAPRGGHICLDLGAADPWPRSREDDAADVAALEWPDPAPLRDRLRRDPLIGRPDALSGEAGRLPFVFDGRRLYTARFWDDQTQLSSSLTALASAPFEAPADAALLTAGLASLFAPYPGTPQPTVDRQQVAGAMAVLRRLTVITGGPGMGKTHTVRNVLALLFAQHEVRRHGSAQLGPLRVALAAPTGKAAARMRESLLKDLGGRFRDVATPAVGGEDGFEALRNFLLDTEASTLHRLLGRIPDDPTRFRHHAQRPLPYDVVVVDETSMVDLAMMARLVEALGERTRLVLIGDRHQLASVEAGTVLADICGPVRADNLQASETLRARLSEHGIDLPPNGRAAPAGRLPDSVIQLDRTFRFGKESSIGRFASACLSPSFDATKAAAPLFSADAPDAAQLDPGDGRALPIAVLKTLAKGYAPTYEHLFGPRPGPSGEPAFHRRALALFDEFRALCAHRRGPTGVEGINAAVRRRLRRDGIDTGDAFWVGRPVLVLRNDYNLRLYNGDIGLVVDRTTSTGRRRRFVAFPAPDGPTRGGEEQRGVRYVLPSRLPQHDTCFALTIHKSQGSEYEHVMVLLPVRPSPIVTRELLYTGVTRARRRVTLVATRSTFEGALARRVQRASGLTDALWGFE